MLTRCEFLEATVVGAAGLAIGTTAKSYERITGANDRLNFAVIGLNGRAYAHLSSLKANRSAARISHVCDVDSNILKKFVAQRLEQRTHNAHEAILQGRAQDRNRAQIASIHASSADFLPRSAEHIDAWNRKPN